jgi:hypothetical protein
MALANGCIRISHVQKHAQILPEKSREHQKPDVALPSLQTKLNARYWETPLIYEHKHDEKL